MPGPLFIKTMAVWLVVAMAATTMGDGRVMEQEFLRRDVILHACIVGLKEALDEIMR